MPAVTVSAGARLHIGFQNLSLARERLYGGIGVGLEQPRVMVTATPAETVDVDDALAHEYATRAVEILDVPGVALTLEKRLPRHVGLGSGTQLALAVLAGVARAYGLEAAVREHAPALGRAGRSGVGVASFETGGFVVDAGHPTGRFTTERPADGDWTVPPLVANHRLPRDWRFLVVVPEADPGRSGADEDASMRTVVDRADPAIADEVAGLLTRRLLPAAAEGRLEAFGEAISAIGQKNGVWYADVQGGVFRPPAGALVDSLSSNPVITGVGQSSWGPAVYGVTDASHTEEATAAAEAALQETGFDGHVLVSRPADSGATRTTRGETG
ncbi:beta-ribofuranosylaminobenzene 5'-phosphate synthase family protein [Natronosalvus vescus]|uniref:beta-ribofuranosylaminobenzene 5'-phosphate synthase family protein n=1 Tax=Natronosalvus vescus TaxID=2953881 RepID=UPI0020916C6D|nr:beta-ribofuranosylaminobenzene 5'-phosphate synthase family protein [Natronosalvus vescus]